MCRRCLLSIALIFLLGSLTPGIVRADGLPESAYIPGFIGHAQTNPLSCESRSAVDWAAFWGVHISEGEFQASLPRSDNPDTGYVGDPNDWWGNIPPNSYGVHAGPVAALLRRYGLRASAKRGFTWDEARAEIAAGRPVIVWIIGQMWTGTPVAYTASDGQQTIVARFEHTMVIIGYDLGLVYAVDAYSGLTQTYSLDAFQASWKVLGNMAVVGRGKRKVPSSAAHKTNQDFAILLPIISGPKPGARSDEAAKEHSPHTAEADVLLPETYVVRRGDFLIALAEQFNLDWRDMARLNGLEYPYVIYPGQVLRLK